MSGFILLAIGLVGQWLLGVAIGNWFVVTPCSTAFRKTTSVRHSLIYSNWFVAPLQAAVADAQRDSTDDSRFVELTGLGFVLGIGTTVFVLFWWSLFGGPLGRGVSLGLTIVGYAAGSPILLRELARRRALKRQSKDHKPTDIDLAERNWCLLCQISVGCLFVLTTVQILMTPQHLWDERASFAIKGIVLSMDGSIRSRDLNDPNFVQFHPRYPLLIPLAEQHIYALLGQIDDRLAKLVFPLLYLGLVLVMAGGMARQLSAASAWFFAVLAATMPVLVPWEYGFPCGQADASMACYHGISALYLWLSWRQIVSEHPRHHFRTSILAGICGALAAFTKDEGIAFLMVDAIAVVLVILLSRQFVRGLEILCSVFGVAAVVLATWIIHRQGLPLTTEANYFGRASMTTLMQKRANLEWEVPHLIRRMFWEFRDWGLQWWLMLFAGVAAPFRALSSPQLFLLLDVVGSIMSLILAGMLAATEVSEHIGGSSHRYLMQLAPVAILFTAGQLGLPRRSVPVAHANS